jgi:hypothetical protein
MQKYPGDPSPWQFGSGLPNAATRSAEIRNEHTLGSEGWQARGKEVLKTLDNLMLDVGCDSPPLW